MSDLEARAGWVLQGRQSPFNSVGEQEAASSPACEADQRGTNPSTKRVSKVFCGMVDFSCHEWFGKVNVHQATQQRELSMLWFLVADASTLSNTGETESRETSVSSHVKQAARRFSV